jgi:S-layer homology domain
VDRSNEPGGPIILRHHRSKSIASIAFCLAVIGIVAAGLHLLARAPAAAASLAAPVHYVFDEDTTFTTTFVLRPGDSVELRNGACLCFGAGGRADWQGTPTSTWSNDGNTQNLERDIEITGSGHVRFERGSGQSIIKFVEINLQPPLELGKYPLHWHHVGDGSRGTLVEGVVIKNSTNRAFVPHASHGITFRDTIAKNIVGDAYWWDPPPFQSNDESSNSNDITFDHALADGVTFNEELHSNHRLSAFRLGSGSGNTVVNSAAMNVTGGKDSSGFHWPETVAGPRIWRFENNVAHHNSANGIFVWQNSSLNHIISGYRGYANGNSDIDHGAYNNVYAYRDVTVEKVEVHALGWSVTGGTIGTVVTKNHNSEGDPVTFTDVSVGQLIIDNASNGGDVPGHYIFTNTDLNFSRIESASVVPGTRVTINGQTRQFGFRDVSNRHVFVNDIQWLVDQGITRGCNPPANTKFCPDRTVTRGQMAAFLTRALRLSAATKDWFRDDNDSVFEDDINRLAEAGITKGCNPPDNTRSCPDKGVNRGQMAAFLVRARGYTNQGRGNLFIDDDGSVYESDIDKLGTAGITKGCNPPTNDRYCPNDPVTRGQMAAFLHRAFR